MKIQASITIPYAVANYADLRDRGFYYVDKTDYIPRLEAYNAPVFLRPRRFGKSLLVSTLALIMTARWPTGLRISLAEHTSEAILHRNTTAI